MFLSCLKIKEKYTKKDRSQWGLGVCRKGHRGDEPVTEGLATISL